MMSQFLSQLLESEMKGESSMESKVYSLVWETGQEKYGFNRVRFCFWFHFNGKWKCRPLWVGPVSEHLRVAYFLRHYPGDGT